LPAIGFALPLRVRALVCVRWPRTGRPLLWRRPQALDVHRGFAAQVALDREVGVDRFADLQDFRVGQVLHAAAMVDAQLVRNANRRLGANSMNIGKCDNNPLVRGDINASNTCHDINLLAPQSTWRALYLVAI
jgi:hypothetical protein